MWSSLAVTLDCNFQQSLLLFSRLCFQVALLEVYPPFSIATTLPECYPRMPVWNAWVMLDFFWMSKFAISYMNMCSFFFFFVLCFTSVVICFFCNFLLQSWHKLEPHHEVILWKSCFSTGKSYENLNSAESQLYEFITRLRHASLITRHITKHELIWKTTMFLPSATCLMSLCSRHTLPSVFLPFQVNNSGLLVQWMYIYIIIYAFWCCMWMLKLKFQHNNW